MPLKLNTSVFGTKVRITLSGEQGIVTGFCLHQRSKSSKQFLVEYVAADGRACIEWFYEDQLTEI